MDHSTFIFFQKKKIQDSFEIKDAFNAKYFFKKKSKYRNDKQQQKI